MNGVIGNRRLNARVHAAVVFHRKNAIACGQSKFCLFACMRASARNCRCEANFFFDRHVCIVIFVRLFILIHFTFFFLSSSFFSFVAFMCSGRCSGGSTKYFSCNTQVICCECNFSLYGIEFHALIFQRTYRIVRNPMAIFDPNSVPTSIAYHSKELTMNGCRTQRHQIHAN